MTTPRSIQEIYGSGEDSDAIAEFLDRSLAPRGPDMLFEAVRALALPAGSQGLDVGCRRGAHAVELARRFGLRMLGIDPIELHIDEGTAALAELARSEPDVAALVSLRLGVVEALPAADASIDLIWCRDVLPHVRLDRALLECARVLRPGAPMLVFQMCATDWLEPAEAERLWPPLAVVPENVDPTRLEAAFVAAGLMVEERTVLASEWREALEEDGTGRTSRQLLHVARLLRARDAFVDRFGQAAYDVELADGLWGVYQMIGKLSPRVYVLRRAAEPTVA
jgi:SAM-dependent methyltransferase